MCQVYVIEIMAQWYPLVAEGLPNGKRCFYVGQTSKDIGERFGEHRTGKPSGRGGFDRSGRVFRKMRNAQRDAPLLRNVDLKLRRTLTSRYEPLETQDVAIELENRLTDELRAQGHAVYPKNNGGGGTPFDSYRDEVP